MAYDVYWVDSWDLEKGEASGAGAKLTTYPYELLPDATAAAGQYVRSGYARALHGAGEVVVLDHNGVLAGAILVG